ncbi:MAG: RecX family transcriptional regulator [Tannerellaceae bacterium]|jgi:regulatory protein|nr:RecX family transcriptional regulator [Tannerellaceae bacterium]
MKPEIESVMMHRMAAYCSTAERCIQDVQKKLQTAGMSKEAAERIIAGLVKEKFIDENRFARSFVNDKLRFNKWGRVRISYELNKKNIPPSLCREAIESIDESVYQSILLSLLKEKKRTIRGKNEQEIFVKLLHFAAGRGFENRETIPCLRMLYKGNDYAEGLE